MGPPNPSRETKFSGANEDSEKLIFPVQLLTTSRIDNLEPCTVVRAIHTNIYMDITAGRLGSSEVLRNPLTRLDVSSIPANGIFLTKKLKKLK